MGTDAPIAMPTDALLTLIQWLSPAYPVGAFAYSHGLEAAADLDWVRDAEGLEDWLKDILLYGSGRADALFIAAAFHSGTAQELDATNDTARAYAASKERLMETDQQGWAFGQITSALWTADLQGLVYPVALGHAAKCDKLPLDMTMTLYLQAFLNNLVAAGQRLLPVGQTDAQRIVQRLSPLCAEIAESSVDGDLTDLSSSTFLSDITSMKHETQYSRIFRT